MCLVGLFPGVSQRASQQLSRRSRASSVPISGLITERSAQGEGRAALAGYVDGAILQCQGYWSPEFSAELRSQLNPRAAGSGLPTICQGEGLSRTHYLGF